MIKTLRRRFVMTTMGILVALYAVIFVFLNVTFTQSEIQRSYSFMRRAAQQENFPQYRPDPGRFEFKPNENGSLSVSFSHIYTIKLDSRNNVISARTETGADVSGDTGLQNLITKASAKTAPQGKIESYRYYREARSYGSILIIADSRYEDASSRRLIESTLFVGTAGLILLFLVTFYLSRFVTKPAEVTFNRQRQFISDASHELKTPLSVISVNADVLSSEIGQNKWLDYIKSEAARMDKLIRQLLDLARMDSPDRPQKKAVFNVSDALYEALLPFESTAFERRINFELDINEDFYMNGEIDGIKQLAAILVDNALKYTAADGNVKVKLIPHENKALLEVFNTGSGISKEDLPHIFERFYMGDKSRTGSDSYGLGLSIAQAIVKAHGGTIKAESEFGKWARFTVTLPR